MMIASSHFSIWQAIFCSLLAHGVFFSASPLLTTAKEGDEGILGKPGKMRTVEARVRQNLIAPKTAFPAQPEHPAPLPYSSSTRTANVPPQKETANRAPKIPQIPPLENIAYFEKNQVEKNQSPEIQKLSPEFGSSAAPQSVPAGAEDGNDGKQTIALETNSIALSGNALAEYRLALKAAIKKTRRYPPQAQAEGITGVVLVRFIWSPRFSAPRVTLESSSGSHLLDEEAVRMITRAAYLTPLPESLRAHNLEWSQPIEFSLK